jgi:hypothetical protein
MILPLSATFVEGELHDITWKGQRILSRLYVAVRDENWGTISGVVESESVVTRTHMQFTVCHADLFRWTGTITLAQDGILTFAFEGEVLKDFRRNRIGFCLLHPAACAGDTCVVTHTNGTQTEATLPKLLCPDQPLMPFTDMAGFTQTLPDGTQVEFEFSGDVFEMEDQRNWTDASFKTFCTPLALPYPVEVKKGERVFQMVVVRPLSSALPFGWAPAFPPSKPTSWEGERGARRQESIVTDSLFPFSQAKNERPVGERARDRDRDRGQIGLAFSPWSPPLTDAQWERLKALKPAHLRVDLYLDGSTTWQEHLYAAVQYSIPLEIAICFMPNGNTRPLRHIEAKLGGFKPLPLRILMYPESEKMSIALDYHSLLEHARDAFPDTPIFLGTDNCTDDFIIQVLLLGSFQE